MNRHLVFGLLVGTAFAAHSLNAAISAKAYVQDGLIAQWDAVANNGVVAVIRFMH